MFLSWPKAAALQPGDRVDVRIDAVLSGQACERTRATAISRQGQTRPIAEFTQSKLQRRIVDSETLHRFSAHDKPPASRLTDGESFLPGRIDGETPQGGDGRGFAGPIFRALPE